MTLSSRLLLMMRILYMLGASIYINQRMAVLPGHKNLNGMEVLILITFMLTSIPLLSGLGIRIQLFLAMMGAYT